MVDPAFRVGGIASGLDTEGLINSLVAIERIPINRMNQQRQLAQARSDAWTDISTKVSAFRTAVDDLRYRGGLEAVSASSSDATVASVSVTGTANPSSLAFTVDQLAATHSVVTSGSHATAATAVGAGTVTLTIDGVDHDVTTTASTTLTQLAASIDALGIGVDASVLTVASGDVRLALTAESSGSDGEFSFSETGTSLGTGSVVSQAANALVTIGSGGGAIQLSRSTNTVSDLVPGVEIRLLATSASAVTVTTERDGDTIADNITAMFTAADAVLTEIDTLTSYDAASEQGSVLTGDAMVRTLDSRISDAMSAVISDLGLGLDAGSPISFRRSGGIDVDRERLLSAINGEFSDLSALLSGAFSTSDSRISAVSTTTETLEGTYDVVVDVAGGTAEVTGGSFSPGNNSFSLTYNSVTDTVAVNESTAAAAASSLNTIFGATAGWENLFAEDAGGVVKVSVPSLTGSSVTFTISGDVRYDLNGTHTGSDPSGTIDGETASISGDRFTISTGDPTGLVADVDLSEVDTSGGSVNVGTITYAGSVLTDLDLLLDDVEGVDGIIARAQDEHDDRIDDIDDQIAAMELRIELRETNFRRQFQAMESMLAQLQGNMSFLSGLMPASG